MLGTQFAVCTGHPNDRRNKMAASASSPNEGEKPRKKGPNSCLERALERRGEEKSGRGGVDGGI